MSTNTDEANRCPSCGRPLPLGTLGGLCPACLLAQGAETEKLRSSDVQAAGAGRARFDPPTLEAIAAWFPQLEVLGLLGAGGMGAVYKARQPSLDRLVALKVLPAGGGAASAERFNREARALARLSHPNIVAVHEFGQVEGLHFFIMEYVDGTNLRQLERTSRLSPREALQIVPQMCDALQYAHDEGIVHRDIKPENVLVDRKGRVKIADFGLAKIVDPNPEAARLTVEGQVMGTPHYMAPEQVERPLAVDHRADIYALGVVFYEMLTGDLPLGRFPPPSRKVQLDVRLDHIVLRALENDPARRYQHASEVKSEVQILTQAPTPAPHTDRAEDVPAVARAVADSVGQLVATRRSIGWGHWVGAWLIAWILLALGFGALGGVADRFLAGWLGLSGVPRLVVRSAMGGLLIAAGVLRALQTPTAPILGGAHGKARAPAWLGHGLRFALLAAGIMLGGTWLQIPFRWLARPMTEAPAASELDAVQVAQRIPETGALRADLPGGGRVELLAVGEPGAVPNGWWTPDGTPVRGATYAVSNSAALFAPAGRPWDLVLRITDLPENTPLVTFDIGTAFNTGGGGEVFQDGRPLAGGRHLRVAWPADARREGFRIGFGGPDWKLVSTHFPPGPSASWNRERGLPDLGYVLTDLVDTEEGARAVFAAGKADHRWRTRLFAIDNEGAEHAPISTRGVGTATSHQVILVFGGIKAAAIRQIRVLAQPFHWVAFQGVALVPNRPVPPPQPLRFDREWEVTFEDLLDLDTGRTGAFPGGRAGTVDVARGAGSFAGLDQDLAWMQEQGFDLEARAGSVGALGLRAVVLDLRDWEGLTPEELGYRLRESGGMPTELKALGPLPAVFGFRTREGALGLLMISDYAGDRPGVTVKAKRVP